jgi:hypothetical protein
MTYSTRKQASMLAADPLSWGQDVIAELITRLPKLQAFVLEDRVVYHNEKGDGLVLVVLQFQNGRAYVPAVVKEWKLQPMDVILYKERKEIQYRYISERNVINLATYVGMGSGALNRNPGFLGAGNTGINLSVPAGGIGGRMSMPAYGTSMGKMASELENYFASCTPVIPTLSFIAYAQKYASENSSFWETNHLHEAIAPAEIKPQSNYQVVVRRDDGAHDLFTDRSENALVIDDDQLSMLFDIASNNDPYEKTQKAASYLKQGVSTLGQLIPRTGNITTSYTPDYLNSDIPEPSLPVSEGLIIYNKQAVYCNPLVTYLDGTPYSYALAVQPGKYTLTKDLTGFHSMTPPDGAELSKEDLLPQAHPDKLMKGQTITFYDGRDRTTTVPCKVLHVSRTPNNIMIHVQPLFGPVEPVKVLFYRGTVKKFDPINPDVLLVPFVETQVLILPSYQVKGLQDPEVPQQRGNLHKIEIQKGGGHKFSIKEDNHYVRRQFNYGDLVYRLIRRYGFGDAQAAKLIKSMDTERVKHFEIKVFLDESTMIAVPTGQITPEEKENAHKFASVAQGLFDVNKGLTNADIKSAGEMDIKLEFLVDQIEKSAADGPPPQNPDPNANQAGPKDPAAPQSGRPGFMDAASKQSPVAKDTQELIDTLTYYSLGKFKGDEAGEVLSKLENSLKESEGYLCKILLLTQMGRIPGHQYSDVKVLLSDMDSYIASIVSSRVLLKSGVS